MKASITYYPNKNKISKRSGKLPLYTRVCLNGKKAEERLSVEFSALELAKWDPITMRFMDRSSTTNSILNSLDQKFQEFLILNSSGLSTCNARMILDHVMGKNKQKDLTVLNFVNDIFNKAIKDNGSLTPGTVRNYRKALNHLKTFLIYRKTEKLLLSQINNDFAFEFKDYLLGSEAKYSKKCMSEVSAAYIIKKFRTIFDRAVDKGLMAKNNFKIIKLKTKSPRRERLNIEQVAALYNLDCSNLPIQNIYKDIFLFSVFTGLSNIDSQELKACHFQPKADGNIKLSIKRTKTSVYTESFLVSFGMDIVNKYRNSPENKICGYILPHRSNKELNVQLKIIAGLCGISFKLTSHIARHTFRQLLAEAGVEDIGVIKRMMGQSHRDAIDDIYYSITDSRLIEAKNRFETFLRNNLINE